MQHICRVLNASSSSIADALQLLHAPASTLLHAGTLPLDHPPAESTRETMYPISADPGPSQEHNALPQVGTIILLIKIIYI